ncbi:MAG: M81 family metallopeptidase [Gammaproteobacteria bacterium]|nr:M81 family metallopeptidase [Gammaproteobacteria bacterium]
MRVLVAQVFQETNSFNVIRTELSDFSVCEGNEILIEMPDTGTILGGILTECLARGLEVVPTIAAMATSGGRVSDVAFESFSEKILQSTLGEEFDFVALDLHGAMMTESFDDPEGEILARLREALGPDGLIGAGLDLHAHLTDRMIEKADVLIPCKKNPHSDFRETGAEVVAALLRCFVVKTRPRRTFLRIPMLLQGNTETHSGPLEEAHRRLASWKREESGALDASLCNCQPFLDAEDMGQVLLFSELAEPGTAATAIRDVALRLWDRRDEFRNAFPTLEHALERVRVDPEGRPFVISDYGDRTNAGAPGDSTVALRRVVECYPDLKVAMPLTDPWAVEAAKRAGVGAELSTRLGARFTKGVFEPYDFTGVVEAISDGSYRMRGPMMSGQVVSAGETAVLGSGNLKLVITSRPARTQDVNFYESLGLKIADFDAVFVKSGNHFQLSYEGIATTLKVDTPGVGAYRPGRMPQVKRAPLYPEANAPEFVLEVQEITARPLAPAAPMDREKP